MTLGSLFAIFEPWIWRRLGPVPACLSYVKNGVAWGFRGHLYIYIRYLQSNTILTQGRSRVSETLAKRVVNFFVLKRKPNKQYHTENQGIGSRIISLLLDKFETNRERPKSALSQSSKKQSIFKYSKRHYC